MKQFIIDCHFCCNWLSFFPLPKYLREPAAVHLETFSHSVVFLQPIQESIRDVLYLAVTCHVMLFNDVQISFCKCKKLNECLYIGNNELHNSMKSH